MRNWKQELYKNQKLIIYGVITLLLIMANYNFYFKPRMESLGKTLPETAKLKRQLSSANILIANIPRYKAQIEDLRNKLSMYRKKFSTSRQTSTLLKELSDLAKKSGVKIVSIRPHSSTESDIQKLAPGAYQKFPISIKAVCGYHQLGNFISKLENADTFMRIGDIRIDSDSNAPTEHQVYLLVNTYVIAGGTE